MTGVSYAAKHRCERHLHHLEQANPHLRRINWFSAPVCDAPLDRLCGVIDSAWKRAYGNRVRVAYSPALLRLACAGHPEEHGIISWAEEDGAPCGVIVGLPLQFETEGSEEKVPATLTTGLSCSAEWEGRGMVEMLMARHAVTLMERGHSFSIHWRATDAQSVSGTARLSRARITRLLGRAIWPSVAARRAGSGFWAKLGIELHSAWYPSGKPLPPSWSMEINTTRAAFHTAQLVRTCFIRQTPRRHYPAGYFQTLSRFNAEGIQGVVAVFREGVEPAGVIWGCINPTAGDAFFLLDGMVFHPEAPAHWRWRALSFLEGYLKENNVFATLAPESAFYPDVPPGWLCLKRYAVGSIPFEPVSWLTPGWLSGIPLELR